MKNTCCFTGHRPNKLFGYDLNNPNYQKLAKVIRQYCRYLVDNHGVDKFISGGALGVDTVAFFAVESLKKDYPHIQNILAIPFVGQSSIWKNKVDIDRYERMLKIADRVVIVDTVEEYKSNTIGQKLNRRNEYMVNNSSYLIATWNGDKSGGTYNCLKFANENGLKIYNTWG